MRKVLTLTALLALGASGLMAADPLSIADAVQKTLTYSPYLEAMREGEKSAGQKIDQARALRAPKLNVGLSETRVNSPLHAFGTTLNQGRIAQTDFDPNRLNDPSAVNNMQVGAQLVVPVYLGGMDIPAREAAKQGVAAATLDTTKAREDVIYQTIEIYFGAVLARESVNVAQKAVDTSRESVKNAEAAVETQRSVESDLLQAKVQRSQNEEALLRRQNQYKLAKEGLATLMGVSSTNEYDLTMPFLRQECVSCKEDPAKLLELALKQRPDYLKLARQIEALNHHEKMQRGALRPKVVLGAGVEHNREDFGDSGKGNSMLFARVDWSAIDGGDARAKAREAQHQQQQLTKMAAAIKDKIFLEIREAVTNINNALERIRVSQEASEQSKESLRILRDRYNAGLAIMTELLGAETSLQSHEMNHLQALYDYALSKARLKMALGELTPEHCEILQPGK